MIESSPSTPASTSSQSSATSTLSTSKVLPAFKRWQDELLELSRANRLLYFRPGRGILTINTPSPDELYQGLVLEGRRYTFYQSDLSKTAIQSADEQLALVLETNDGESTSTSTTGEPPAFDASVSTYRHADAITVLGDAQKIQATLYRLRQRARTSLHEQGINVLFVVFGMLEWIAADDANECIQSPLLLMPVRLERENALAPYQLVPLDEHIVLNPVLRHKLELDFGLKLTLPNERPDEPGLAERLDHIMEALGVRRSDWRVVSTAHLGLFSFAKYAMYEDLKAHEQQICAHPVIRMLSRERDDMSGSLAIIPSAEQLDEQLSPHETFQVLDADASQQEAIAAVNAGVNLVIQGPPGTGKSQTITNIIAETLARGKTVLFVSEKMAALRVVASRLQSVGLREFCLEAHSQDLDRAGIIRDLADILQAGPRVRPGSMSIQHMELDRLAQLRRELNAYVGALHDTNTPLGVSAFYVHGELAKRLALPAIAFDLSDIGRLTQQRLAELVGVVKQVGRVGQVLLHLDTHPWYGCDLPGFSPAIQVDLEHRFRVLEQAVRGAHDLQSTICVQLGLPPQDSLVAVQWLSELLAMLEVAPPVPREWWCQTSLRSLSTEIERYRSLAEEYHRRRAALLDCYQDELWTLDSTALLKILEKGSFPYAQVLRGNAPPLERAFQLRERLPTALEQAVRALQQLHRQSAIFAQQAGIATPVTLADAQQTVCLACLLTEPIQPVASWLNPKTLARVEHLAAVAARHYEQMTTAQLVLDQRFQPEAYALLTEEWCQRFEQRYSSRLRICSPRYHYARRQLKALLRRPASLRYRDIVEDLRQVRCVHNARQWFEQHRDELREAFGHFYTGIHTDWALVRVQLALTRAVFEHFADGLLPEQLRSALLDMNGRAARIQAEAHALVVATIEAETALAALGEMLTWSEVASQVWSMEVPCDHRAGLEAIASLSLRAISEGLQALLDGLNPFWMALHKVLSLRTAPIASLADLVAELHELEDLRGIEARFVRGAPQLRRKYGSLFNGINTSWEQVVAALNWTRCVLDHMQDSLPDTFLEAVSRGVTISAEQQQQLRDHLVSIEQGYDFIRRIFPKAPLQIDHCVLEEASLTKVAQWVAAKRAAVRQIEEWFDLQDARQAAEKAGIWPFIKRVIDERIPPEDWEDIFLRQVYTLWLSWRYQQVPALARFRGHHHETLIEEFRRLDQLHWQRAATRIAERLVTKRPVLPANFLPTSELAILLAEASKRRRFRPLRRLFAEIPNLLVALKPCMLMSPLSVAQLLGDTNLTFDLVIFDEASQIMPADAIGSIMRGRQIVVVGDQQQLPPTRFFVAETRIMDEENDEEVPESILDACLAVGMPTRSLLWHYRSRHESLIAFSNLYFYGRRLVTFPAPVAEQQAVEFEYVEHGVYDRAVSRVNRIEAQIVAQRVIEHVKTFPHLSLGVITFSEAQMLAIQTALEVCKREQPELESLLREDGVEGFFVKNLENVQGDERDVIIFSVGYGRDHSGYMTMHFGPLNRNGGDRRLNVAITRARYRVKIIASFLPHDIDLRRTQAKGVILLRRYLEYAQHGPRALLGAATSIGGEAESPFEAAVADALRAHGLDVVHQVGVGAFRIDLAIRDPEADRYLLGIECDGATYHSSKTARDRDRLRQQVLEQLGWKIVRIWSTEWVKDPAGQIGRVLQALKELPAQPASVSQAPESRNEHAQMPEMEQGVQEAKSLLSSPIEPPPRESIAVPYTTVRLGKRGGPKEFMSSSSTELAELVHACVKIEGPVHQERVMRVIAESYQISRLGKNYRNKLGLAISEACRSKGIVQRGAFLWPATMREPQLRKATAKLRPIDEVAPEEIAVAVRQVLRLAFSMQRDALIASVAHELGFHRTGAQVESAIENVVEKLLDAHEVVEEHQKLRLRI